MQSTFDVALHSMSANSFDASCMRLQTAFTIFLGQQLSCCLHAAEGSFYGVLKQAVVRCRVLAGCSDPASRVKGRTRRQYHF